MKRKLLMAILTVALTLALIPSISAFADTDGDGILGIFTEDQDQEGDEAADIEENEDADEDVDADAELPKLNLKSPVLHFGPGDLGETYALTPRIGAEKVDPMLIAWSSSDTSVATVSEDGTVTVVGLGRAEITAVMLDASALPGKAKVFVLNEKKDKDNNKEWNDDPDEDSNKGKADNPGKNYGKDKGRGDEGDNDGDEDGDSQGDDVNEDGDSQGGDGDEDGDSQGDEDGDDQGEDGDSNPENASGDE